MVALVIRLAVLAAMTARLAALLTMPAASIASVVGPGPALLTAAAVAITVATERPVWLPRAMLLYVAGAHAVWLFHIDGGWRFDGVAGDLLVLAMPLCVVPAGYGGNSFFPLLTWLVQATCLMFARAAVLGHREDLATREYRADDAWDDRAPEDR